MVIRGIVVIFIVFTVKILQASANTVNNFNIHFFVIFASPPSEESIDESLLASFSKFSTRFFHQTNVSFVRVTFTTVNQENSPLGIIKLHAALRGENFAEKSPFIRRRFIVIVGQGSVIQQAIVAVRTAFSHSEEAENSVTVFVYDEDFFNHANVTDSIYQLNQDRQTLVAPLLASTVLHKSHPKGGLVVLIHDLTLVSDQLYTVARSLFNTLVLVTDDENEDVVALNLKNEIAPNLNNIHLTQSAPAATFVVHVANSKSISKVFGAANRINLLSSKYVWIVSDRKSFIGNKRAGSQNKKTAADYYLKGPVKTFLLPKNLIALEIDRHKLFTAAFNRLLNGLAKSIGSRLKATRPKRFSDRFMRTSSSGQIDIYFKDLFETDGSAKSGTPDRRGGGRYYSDDAKYVSAVQVAVDQFGGLVVEKVSLRHAAATNMTKATMATRLPIVNAETSVNGSGSGSLGPTEPSDLVISDAGSPDDVIPHLLQVYISLGPPFLFVKPVSHQTGDCQGPAALICEQIIPGDVTTMEPLPVQTQPAYRCCSGLVPDLVRSLAKDLNVKARIFVSAVGGDTIDNTTVALDLLNKRSVDMIFTADPYIQHRSAIRYYVTDPFFTSSYAMLVAIRRKEPSLLSFLSPFPFSVWVGIVIILAPVTALSISQFEWHSPFGLNPWGRKRSTNYTLGSALNMVYALLFGHTVKTKCPKAWPSKWTQNFWAGFAIFVIASYTGNLASFLAKRHESVEYDSIYDLATADHTVKVGAVRDDPIISWLRLAVSDLAKNLVVVDTLEDAVRRLRQSELEVLIGELAMLRYWQLTDDATACSTKLLPRSFADRELAPAMLVDSQFRAIVAGKMREYKITGEFEQLVSKNRFVSLSLQGGSTACGNDQSNGLIGGAEWAREAADTQLTLRHANGLFLTMVFAIVACCFILVAEYLTYYCVVPKLRVKKRTSFWRGFTLMYFSQRIYRILNSEELLRPTQVLKEMIEVIKRLEFSRIFQKSARKKRFRKMSIAEFVQQVKDEKEKALPDIVVQTKGIHRARKAWRHSRNSPSRQTSSASTAESFVDAVKAWRHGRNTPSRQTSSASTAESVGETATTTRIFRKGTSVSSTPDRFQRRPSIQHVPVQRELALSSSSSLSSLQQVAELELKKPFVSTSPKNGDNTTVEKKQVTFAAVKPSPHVSLSDTVGRRKTSSLTRKASRPPDLPPISDVSPKLRWQWVRDEMNAHKTEKKRVTMLSVYKEEMDKLVTGRARLEQTVAELCKQLEQIRQERDRLLLVQELENASTV